MCQTELSIKRINRGEVLVLEHQKIWRSGRESSEEDRAEADNEVERRLGESVSWEPSENSISVVSNAAERWNEIGTHN